MLTSTDLNKLVIELTNVGYHITDLLNRGIDGGETEVRLNKLREVAALVGQANGEAFRLYQVVKTAERLDEIALK